MHLLTRGEYAWAAAHVAAHLAGSLGMTLLGLLTVRALMKA
jgi:fluoride ion exporter CrcB/FEX